MPKKDASIKLIGNESGREVELPVLSASEGPDTLDTSRLPQKLGLFTFDPGFVSTASCESKITYIDGKKGLLRYRGYPIEELAEHSNFVESAYLLYYGELPDRTQLDRFNQRLADHAAVERTAMVALQNAFPRDAHPMAMLMASISLVAALHHKEKNIHDTEYRETAFLHLLAKMATITAWIFRHHLGKKTLAPDPQQPYTENFLRMMFTDEGIPVNDTFVKAMDLILLLHADHEQNASTSALRVIGSTETSPYAALVGGIASLWGPAHGGANEAVVKMLENIVLSGKSIDYYIARAKDRKSNFRLMGFGHRVYKNYDPRAKIIRKICHSLLSELGADNPNRPLLETAMQLETIALEDEYFISRKLYPNVDFYSGIILSAMKLPLGMFTTIFALARTAGWLSHWNEMMSEKHARIYRPRQLYTGRPKRSYLSIDQR